MAHAWTEVDGRVKPGHDLGERRLSELVQRLQDEDQPPMTFTACIEGTSWMARPPPRHLPAQSIAPGAPARYAASGSGRGRPSASTATSTNSACVTRTRSPCPCRNTQVSTPSVTELRPVCRISV